MNKSFERYDLIRANVDAPAFVSSFEEAYAKYTAKEPKKTVDTNKKVEQEEFVFKTEVKKENKNDLDDIFSSQPVQFTDKKTNFYENSNSAQYNPFDQFQSEPVKENKLPYSEPFFFGEPVPFNQPNDQYNANKTGQSTSSNQPGGNFNQAAGNSGNLPNYGNNDFNFGSGNQVNFNYPNL